MESPCSVSPRADQSSRRSYLCNFFPVACLLCLALFIGTTFLASDYKEFGVQKFTQWGGGQKLRTNKCENRCRPPGSEALPQGIVASTSNLEMIPLWNSSKKNITSPANLFVMAVGIKQKYLVNKMVVKFVASGFAIMLFHYDGAVDEWKDFEWHSQVIHVSATSQTKWWFAKRFLHPDIVAEYDYIFLWDEDLGVDDFHPEKYLSIIEREGLEISQPALDPAKSEIHHLITARLRNSIVHRRTYRPGGPGKVCNAQSTSPPCTGWIEMMAPVFSRAAWRCVWYLIQNDLIYAWGLDMQLGYCAQGDRMNRVGIVDAEYVVHYNRPTLGGADEDKTQSTSSEDDSGSENAKAAATPKSHKHDPRVEVRRQSYVELAEFKRRWRKASREDRCWVNPYPQSIPL
ncbi:uncharacterized protein LOC116193117 isoform X1 [Punica granatum]|uniref:Uncharacterized protein LOC116193117 isoform X1 n=1 Tax=Punica granatum TaxID=22663 RepID=A0A6P8C2N0_PUNGR|nr:uncharacterized protein LOC116193117 isoform X1 [Punica granatum]